MKIAWRDLPIGEFLGVKRLVVKVGEGMYQLYLGESEKAEDALETLQSEWTEFLEKATESHPSEIDSIADLTYTKLMEIARSFFAHAVGADQRPKD